MDVGGQVHKFHVCMKNLKSQDKQVFKLLKDQAKAEAKYNEPFKLARELVKKRDEERLSGYEKFKRQQRKENEANDMLIGFLSKKS